MLSPSRFEPKLCPKMCISKTMVQQALLQLLYIPTPL